ncbi:MAG: Nif3-like dinuclear metal center hexameric protein [Clostridia bacterium]|jgi:dinuclear metal center YbgI/SA1388 family protein|nr:Nif3-like dinuclear metal center hexameric protein [Clostridia bacterium]
MPKVKDIIEKIESKAPLTLALDFDSAGLNVGDGEEEVKGILLAQSVTYSTLEECERLGANLLITHHPCVFGEETDRYMQSLVAKAKEKRINLYSCHTNLDCCVGGLNDFVADILGMQDVSIIDGCARGGYIPPVELKELAKSIANALKDDCVKYVGADDKIIKKVALCTGAGARDEELVDYAVDNNVDCIIGGESKLSIALMAKDYGVSIIDVGHYTSEIACVHIFKKWLEEYEYMIRISKTDINPYKSIK